MSKWVISGVLLCTLGVALALVRPERGPKPELRVVGKVVLRGMDTYEMELSNPTAHELAYLYDYIVGPRLELRFWENGQWKKPSAPECGGAWSREILPAGGKVQFFYRPPREGSRRVGVAMEPPDFRYDDVHEFEWLPKQWNEWLVDWQYRRILKRMEDLIAWAPPLEAARMTPAELAFEEAGEAGVVMDLANLLEVDRFAAGPPPPSLAPAAFSDGSDPFAPAQTNPSLPPVADPFAPKP